MHQQKSQPFFCEKSLAKSGHVFFDSSLMVHAGTCDGIFKILGFRSNYASGRLPVAPKGVSVAILLPVIKPLRPAFLGVGCAVKRVFNLENILQED